MRREAQGRRGGLRPVTWVAYTREWVIIMFVSQHKTYRWSSWGLWRWQQRDAVERTCHTRTERCPEVADLGLNLDCVPLNRGTDVKWPYDIVSWSWDFTKDTPIPLLQSVANILHGFCFKSPCLLWMWHKAENILEANILSWNGFVPTTLCVSLWFCSARTDVIMFYTKASIRNN